MFVGLFAQITTGSIWSASSDLAHHGVLVTRLCEQWTVEDPDEPTLGEMNFYPRYSHLLAAVVGRAIGSPLAGMHLVGQFSILVMWYALGVMLRRQSDSALASHLFCLGMLLLVVRHAEFEILGHEMVAHYFFAQSVGTAGMLSFLAIWLSMRDVRTSLLFRYALPLGIAVFLLGCHGIPAVQLLGFVLGTVVVDLVISGDMRRAAAGVVSLSAAVAAILVHPASGAMVEIAANNGSLRLKWTPTLDALFVLTLMTLVLSTLGVVVSVRRASREGGEMDLLGVISLQGAVVTGLCLTQLVAFLSGHGSEYACKKYGFGINTSLVLILSLGTSRILLALSAGTHWERRLRHSGKVLRPHAAAVIMVAGVMAVHPPPGPYAVSRLLEVERALLDFQAANLESEGQRRDIAQGIAGVGAIGDYALSIGALRHPRDHAANNILVGRLAVSPRKERFLITRQGRLDLVGLHSKDLPIGADLAVYEGAAAAAHGETCAPSTDFSSAGIHGELDLIGFGLAEATGRWTVGLAAQWLARLPASLVGRVRRVRIVLGPGFLPDGRLDEATVSLNGAPPIRFTIEPVPFEVLVPFVPGTPADRMAVRFEIPGARSPRSLGVSDDARALGLFVRRIDLETQPSSAR